MLQYCHKYLRSLSWPPETAITGVLVDFISHNALWQTDNNYTRFAFHRLFIHLSLSPSFHIYSLPAFWIIVYLDMVMPEYVLLPASEPVCSSLCLLPSLGYTCLPVLTLAVFYMLAIKLQMNSKPSASVSEVSYIGYSFSYKYIIIMYLKYQLSCAIGACK